MNLTNPQIATNYNSMIFFGNRSIEILHDIYWFHSYDILGARMLWKPKEARILKNFIDQPM